MPKKMKIDFAKLIKMVEEGGSQKTIMDHFGFKNSSQLKVAYANALMEAGKVAGINTGRGEKDGAAADRTVAVGKRGSLVIPKGLVARLGLSAGDTFQVRGSRVGLSLKKLTDK